MGIAQSMENLAGEIKSATAARSVFFTNLMQDVEKHRQGLKRQMNDLHNENRNKARKLREKWTSEERGRQNTARQDAEQRRVAVSELRSNTYSLLNRAQLERKEMARELKEMARALQEKVSSEGKARIKAARQMMNDTRRAVNNICRATRSMLGEVATDLRGARKAWAGVKKKY